MVRHGGVALVAAISPFRAVRDEIKATYPNVLEVYIEATVEECAARDVKGLYAKAKSGEIKNFTGISDPYEPPLSPDITLRTGHEPVEASAARLLSALAERGVLS